MEYSRYRQGWVAISTGATSLVLAVARIVPSISHAHALMLGAGIVLSALGLWNVFTARID